VGRDRAIYEAVIADFAKPKCQRRRTPIFDHYAVNVAFAAVVAVACARVFADVVAAVVVADEG